ncbi:MAG: MoxR family ATPase [Elusimicrobiota bacterium]
MAGKDTELVDKLIKGHRSIINQLKKIIVGQDGVINQLLIALFARGHCVIVGVPGLAKTLLVSSLAEILDLQFKRIQFTPDLMPSDITGTEVIEQDAATGGRNYRFIKGPVFANIILADEINRTPPKTQSALLQAMQEYRVTSAGQTYPVPMPFYVLATQNPIEQEGTYPLPEAQLDRFFFQINIDYPSADEEKTIVQQTTGATIPSLDKVLDADEIIQLQEIVRRVPVSDNVIDYVVRFVGATRPRADGSPDFVKQWLNWGAGPRASQALILGAKARALLDGRYSISIEDIQKLAHPALRHRLILNFNAEAEGITTDDVITKLVSLVPA